MINPKLEIGDEVVLLRMDGDQDPITYGTKGKVIKVSKVFGFLQYTVKWETNRILDLLEDADKWMKLEDFINLKKRKGKQ